MKDKIIKALKIIVPLGIGVYLTWYFFAGLTDNELEQTKNAVFEANYFWVILSLVVSFLSHLSRAVRWRFLLEPMGYKVSLSNAYHSVMSGYVINFTVPRSGEFARAGLLTTYESVPFEKGFATIVVERVIDVLMLGAIVFVAGILQTDSEAFKEITATEGGGTNSGYYLLLIIGGIIMLSIVGILYRLNAKFRTFFIEKLKGFWEGLKTVWTAEKKWLYVAHTFFIWFCYVIGIWIFAQAFEETKDMSIACVFGAFVVGAAAIALLPGGIGAYPTWITAVLLMYGMDFPAYGIFIWVVQTALIVVLGLISLFLIQRKPKVNG